MDVADTKYRIDQEKLSDNIFEILIFLIQQVISELFLHIKRLLSFCKMYE